MIQPARFRSLLAFKSRSRAADGAGGTSQVLNTVAEQWCNVANASGSESYLAQQLRSDTQFIITTRSNPDIKADMLVVDRNGRILEVLDVLDDDDSPRFMRIPCKQFREKTETPPQIAG